MSVAERKAYDIYNQCNIGALAPDVKRQLIMLIQSKTETTDNNSEEEDITIPQSLDEAMKLGAVGIESARAELHSYADRLIKEYDLL